MSEPVESSRIFYVDLTLGAWRPHEAATQLAVALGVDLKPPHDRETRSGDSVILYAHAAAADVAKALPDAAIVAVLAPRFGFGFRRENEWFLLFLKRRGASVSLVGGEPSTTVVGRPIFEPRRAVTAPGVGVAEDLLSDEQQRILRFFPGLLPGTLAAAAGLTVGNAFLVPVGRSHFLIPPAFRDIDPSKAPRDFDALTELEPEDSGLKAFAANYGTAHFVDSAFVAGMSRAVAERGGADLARELALRARHVARTPENMAIADLRCLEACRLDDFRFGVETVPAPSRQASEDVRNRLARMSIEAAIARGDAIALARQIAPLEARFSAGPTLADDDLVLLVGAVEVLTTIGHTSHAAAIVNPIRTTMEGRSDVDQVMAFRLARSRALVCSRMGDPEGMRIGLDEAFAISAGTRDLNDIIEMNALRAKHETDPTGAAARNAWLRAVLAWLAFDPPEGLCVNAARAMLDGRELSRASLDLDISELLVDRLASAWPSIDAAIGGDYWPVRAATGTDRPTRLFGAPGVSVLWSDSPERPPIYIRPRVRLAKMVRAILGSLCPAVLEVGKGCLLIDHNLGTDLAATREAALSVALRKNVEDVVFEFETIVLDPTNRSRLVGQIVVGISPAVLSIEKKDDVLQVRFRHGPEVRVSGRPAEALALLLDKQRMQIGALAVLLGETVLNAERLYRDLEALGVLRMDVESPADKVRGDGIASPAPTPPEP